MMQVITNNRGGNSSPQHSKNQNMKKYSIISDVASMLIEETKTQVIDLRSISTYEIRNALEYVRELATQMYLTIDADDFYATIAKELENGNRDEMPLTDKVINALIITRNYVDIHLTINVDESGITHYTTRDPYIFHLHNWYREVRAHFEYAASKEYQESLTMGIRVIG